MNYLPLIILLVIDLIAGFAGGFIAGMFGAVLSIIRDENRINKLLDLHKKRQELIKYEKHH